MDILKQLTNFIYRHWKITFLMLLLALFFYVILTYTIVIVGISDKTANAVFAPSLESVKNRVSLRNGLNIVRAGSGSISSNGELDGQAWQTSIKVSYSRFTINRTEVKIKKQQKIEKILKLTEDNNKCVFGSQTEFKSGIGYLYSCGSGSTVVRQQTSFSPLTRVLQTTTQRSATPYLDGILVTEKNSSTQPETVSFINNSRKQVVYKADSASENTSLSVHTSNKPGSKEFVIIDMDSGTVTSFSELGAKNKSLKDNDFKGVNSDQASLIDNKFFVYKNDQLMEFDISGSTIKKTRVLAWKRPTGFTKLYAIDSENFSGGIGNGVVTIYKASNDSVVYKKTIGQAGADIDKHSLEEHGSEEETDISSIEVSNGLVYYTEGSSVYSYSPAEEASWLVHYSESIKITSIQRTGEGIIVSGTPKNTPSSKYLYLLTPKEKHKQDTSDILPYSPNDLPILSMDFTNSQVFVVLNLDTLVRDRDTGAATYEDSEMETNKAIVQTRLRSDLPKGYNFNIVPDFPNP